MASLFNDLRMYELVNFNIFRPIVVLSSNNIVFERKTSEMAGNYLSSFI